MPTSPSLEFVKKDWAMEAKESHERPKSIGEESAKNEDFGFDMHERRKKKSFDLTKSCLQSNTDSRRKNKVDWTPELHDKFVEAIDKLGIDRAFPSKILELMKVEGLTRHNVASHLQKFRLHKKNILPKKYNGSLHIDTLPNSYLKKPIVAFPAYNSNYIIPPNQVYQLWPQQTFKFLNAQVWRCCGLSETNFKVHADAWGCPVLPNYTYSHCCMPPQGYDINNSGQEAAMYGELKNNYDPYLANDVIEAMVKEALRKPWLPLPIGLKPPSLEKILIELHHQGIQNISLLPKQGS